LLVRPGQDAPLEVYMIRRQQNMRFLAGYYAFPGGKVEPQDAEPEILDRCHGLPPADAERAMPAVDGFPALSFWVAAARELLEETGVLAARDVRERPGGNRVHAGAERPGDGADLQPRRAADARGGGGRDAAAGSEPGAVGRT